LSKPKLSKSCRAEEEEEEEENDIKITHFVVYRNLIDEMNAPILYLFKCSDVSQIA